MTLQYRTS